MSTGRGGGDSDRGVPTGRAERRWFAVYTQNFREQRALVHLRNQGYEAYLALHEKTIRHSRRLMTVRRPVFPRYVFIMLDLSKDRWRSVNGTFGVSHLVMDGDLPLPVPRGVIEALIAATDEHGLVRHGRTLAAGDRVQVLTGPFADMVGELLSVDESGRVRILLDMMGSIRPVQARMESLAPAG